MKNHKNYFEKYSIRIIIIFIVVLIFAFIGLCTKPSKAQSSSDTLKDLSVEETKKN